MPPKWTLKPKRLASMPRTNRYFSPRYRMAQHPQMPYKVFFAISLTARDTRSRWLLAARRRYGLRILNYTVASNHIHLLVIGEDNREVIPRLCHSLSAERPRPTSSAKAGEELSEKTAITPQLWKHGSICFGVWPLLIECGSRRGCQASRSVASQRIQ